MRIKIMKKFLLHQNIDKWVKELVISIFEFEISYSKSFLLKLNKIGK